MSSKGSASELELVTASNPFNTMRRLELYDSWELGGRVDKVEEEPKEVLAGFG